MRVWATRDSQEARIHRIWTMEISVLQYTGIIIARGSNWISPVVRDHRCQVPWWLGPWKRWKALWRSIWSVKLETSIVIITVVITTILALEIDSSLFPECLTNYVCSVVTQSFEYFPCKSCPKRKCLFLSCCRCPSCCRLTEPLIFSKVHNSWASSLPLCLHSSLCLFLYDLLNFVLQAWIRPPDLWPRALWPFISFLPSPTSAVFCLLWNTNR